jgi:membrane associated rhomboid family serine protease
MAALPILAASRCRPPVMPPITQALLIANVAVYLLQTVAGQTLGAYFALWPLGTSSLAPGLPGFWPWQLLTYSFLHGGLTHLAFNMLALYMFGGDLERLFGRQRFVALYFASVLAAGLVQLVVASFFSDNIYPTVGASGGVFGILLAFGWVFPDRIIVPLIPPIPMRARVFVVLYGAIELVLGVTGTQEGVAHFAHLGGMLGAWILLSYWRAGRRR